MNGARRNHTATLLPDETVLAAGGHSGTTLFSAELYNAASGYWVSAGPLNTPRENHTAVLMPSGKILVAGGWSSSGAVASSEIYDGANETWTGKGTWTTNAMLTHARASHTAALLPDGAVLLAGGYDGTFLFGAELYNVDMGAGGALRPEVSTAPSEIELGGGLALSGSGFRGVSGGSSGNSGDSPTDRPIVQLRSLESVQTTSVFPVNWSSNSFTSDQVTGMPPGYALLTVFVNGIPSNGRIVNISVPRPTASPLVASIESPNGNLQITFTNSPGTLFAVLASTNLTLPISNWIVIGSASEVSPGHFEFSDSETNFTQRFYRAVSP
jgi:hypothetical protein